MILRYFKLALAAVLLTLSAFSSFCSHFESRPISVPHYYIPNDINTANLPVVLVCVLEESPNCTLVNRLYAEVRVEHDVCHIKTDRYNIYIEKKLENFNCSSMYRRIKPLKPNLIFTKLPLSFFALALSSLTANLFSQPIFTGFNSADWFDPVKRGNGLPAAGNEANFPFRFIAEIASVKSLIFESKTTRAINSINIPNMETYDNPYISAF